MKQMRLIAMMAAVMFLGACSGRQESLTGSYGEALLSGQVVVTGANSSPAGVEVSVRGTGMTISLAEDGAFAFAGVPAEAELTFRRASDGIDASLRVDPAPGMIIEVSGTTARKSSRRRSAGRGSGEAFQFEGTIRSATAASIVVFTSKKEEVTIALTPETVIRKGNQTLTAADLVVGVRVHVKARKAGEAYSAIEVKLQEGDGEDDEGPLGVREYEGTVRSAGATQLIVFTSHREEVTFTLNAATVIRKGGTTVAAGDIQAGWRVHVKATVLADGTKTALRVTIQNQNSDDDAEDEAKVEGKVASVGADSLIVTTSTGPVTVQTTRSTQIRRNGKKITLDDVRVGNTVEVEGQRVNATTVQAKKINVED